MLRVIVGSQGYLSSISRDGKLLPASKATIYLDAANSTKVVLELIEATGGDGGLKKWDEVVDAAVEEVQLVNP